MNTSTQSTATQALFRAARDGSVKGVHRALAAGAEVEAERRSDGCTPIQVAAEKGHGDVVRALHGAGARVWVVGFATGSARAAVDEILVAEKVRMIEDIEADPKEARRLVEAVDAAILAWPGAEAWVRATEEAVAVAQAVAQAAQRAMREQERELWRMGHGVGARPANEVRLTAARRVVKIEDDRALLRQAAGLPATADAVAPKSAQRRKM